MNDIFKTLGFTKDNGLYVTKEREWLDIFPNRIEEFFEGENSPDAFFCISNKPIILFYQEPKDKKKLFKSVWNFNESPIIFIVEADNIEIYSGFKYLKDRLSLLPIDYKEIENFKYLELITGKTWQDKKNSYKDRVDYHLLENIKSARNILLANGLENGLANKLIGKTIFTRYLIDRNVKLGYSTRHGYLSNDDFAKILENKEETEEFFTYLQDKFNGDVFKLTDSDYDRIDQSSIAILRELILGTEMSSGQMSLFDIYDFSIIPIEFISNVYELFIGEGNQKKAGAYYTPLFLVDYVLSQTIERYFKENPGEVNCKILDPACGSGIFLVEAYRKIIRQYLKNNPKLRTNSTKYKEAIKQLAKDNIFGIDKDVEAISVATFSIYLTMLHYQAPPDIEDFVFPSLKESNFFEGDFFDEKFNKHKSLKDIHFIIGNPPWQRGKKESGVGTLYLDYIKKRTENEAHQKFKVSTSNKEIAQAFLLRVSDFSAVKTKTAFIVTSKILYNLNAKNFRSYFLENYFIDKVFELAAVRKEIFASAKASAVVLFYHCAKGVNTDNNVIEHIALKRNRIFSMFKIFSIQRNDYKRVVQKKLKESDYLWKVLLYGNYLDYNFVQRLKKDDFVVGQGVNVGNRRNYDASHLIGKDTIEIGKDIFPYYITPGAKKWSHKKVERIRDKRLFVPPFLAITGGVSTRANPKNAISYKKRLYQDAVTGIKTEEKNIPILREISAVLSSSLFSYFAIQKTSTVGIDRRKVLDVERWEMPLITDNSDISILVEKVEMLQKKYHTKMDNLDLRKDELLEEIDSAIQRVDDKVLESFNLSDEEKSLIDYATEITIPMIMNRKGYESIFTAIEPDGRELKEYVQVFFDRFDETFNNIGLYLTAEIWYSRDIIGIFFKEMIEPAKERVKILQNANNSLFIEKIASLGVEKITEKLFVQKDIRGFEEDGFYIIKPNERRLWHNAISYLDMYEFADAIFRAGREETNV